MKMNKEQQQKRSEEYQKRVNEAYNNIMQIIKTQRDNEGKAIEITTEIQVLIDQFGKETIIKTLTTMLYIIQMF